MADEAAVHHHTREIDFGYEDKRFLRGVLIVQAGKQPAVRVGQISAPGAKLMKTCDICNEPGHMMRDCPDKSKRQTCRNCNELGHQRVDCPSVLCRNCHETGHVSRDCTQQVCCRTCLQPGHKSKECSKRGRKRQPRSGADSDTCSNCGLAGHGVEDCMGGNRKPAPIPKPAEIPVPKPAEIPVPKPAEIPVPKPAEAISSVGGGSDAVEEQKLETPKGMDESPADGGMVVKMQTVLSPEHLSSIGFTLEGHYPSQAAYVKDGYEHKSVNFYFSGANFQHKGAGLNAAVIEPTSDLFTKHVTPEQAAIVEGYVGTDSVLVHVQICASTAALGAGAEGWSDESGETSATPRPLFGLAMFSDADFGNLQPEYEAIRDMLAGEDLIHIDFFAVRSADEVDRAKAVFDSMREQYVVNPCSKWWKGGCTNPQTGQAIAAAERPTGFRIHKRHSFRDAIEYTTIQFHNLTDELEGMEGKAPVLTRAKFARFPGGGDQLYYAHVDAPPDTHFREGAAVTLKLLGPDAEEDTDFVFKVIESVGYANASQYSGFAYRPRLAGGKGFQREPEFIKDEHVVDTTEYPDSASMFRAMSELRGVKCYVHEQQPRVGVKRAIKTLNHLHLGGSAFDRERQLLLANDLCNLPAINYFAQLVDAVGQVKVDEEMGLMSRNGLNPEQLRVIDGLKAMKGGILLVQGPGGVGKSEIIVYLARLHYRLRCKYGHDNEAIRRQIRALWVVASMNKPLDGLTAKINAACNEERVRLGDKGMPVIVIRRHMGATEKHVYRRRAEEARAVLVKDTRPPYYDADEAEEEEADLDLTAHSSKDLPPAVFDLITAVRVQRPFASTTVGQNFDKRLQLPELSEGQYILHRAGVPDEKTGEPHEIAAEPAKYRNFRAMLDNISKGMEMGEEDYESLTLDANAIVRELAEMAIVICMTPDVVSQTRAHTLQQPYAVLHDEAGKTPEMGTVAALVFSRPYTVGNGPLRVVPDSHVPHVLFGDIHQPPPVLGRDAQYRPFGQQNSVSVFQRWVLGGAQTVWLWEQHRSNQDIIDLVNHIHPRGRMRASDAVEAREQSAIASTCAKQVFGSNKRVVFMNVRGKTEVLPTTKSRYNDSFIVPAIAAIRKVILGAMGKERDDKEVSAGFHGKDIGIIAAYVAQVATYRHVIDQYRDSLLTQEQDSSDFWLGLQLNDVEIFTVDKMQGAQKEFIVHCTTASETLGFTQEATRQLLANGRARSLLLIVGDPTGVKAAYADKKGKGNAFSATAYYKAFHWCSQNKSVVNLSLANGRLEEWQLNDDFTASEYIANFHLEKGSPDDAFQFDQDAKYGSFRPGAADGGFGGEDGGFDPAQETGFETAEDTAFDPAVDHGSEASEEDNLSTAGRVFAITPADRGSDPGSPAFSVIPLSPVPGIAPGSGLEDTVRGDRRGRRRRGGGRQGGHSRAFGTQGRGSRGGRPAGDAWNAPDPTPRDESDQEAAWGTGDVGNWAGVQW